MGTVGEACAADRPGAADRIGTGTERPYVLLSCAMSVDGCLDAPGRERLVLSGDADLDRVDDERAGATRSWSARAPSAATTRAC